MIAVFARSDHPPGYGYPPREGERGGRAHGYVVLLVECHDQDQLRAVRERLAREFYGKGGKQFTSDGPGYNGGHLSEWYGGKFDLIAVLAGATEALVGGHLSHGRFASLGDNRFVGHYDAAEVLAT